VDFKLQNAFPINWRMWALTKASIPGSDQALQGFVVAAATGTKYAGGREQSFYLIVEQQGRVPPMWIEDSEIVRAEIQKEAVEEGSGRFLRR
jgi:hypothetical protein